MTDSYTELFARYAAHTDGKKIIAAELLQLFPQAKHLCLIDVGAGSGEIASRIASAFKQVTALEPKDRFIHELRQYGLPNLEVVQGKIETFETTARYDVALLSYVLDSQTLLETTQILTKVEELLTPQGRILGVTFLDGCAWNVFSTYLASLTQHERGGGLRYVSENVRQSGRLLRPLKILDTQITGSDLNDLYRNLAFYSWQNPALYTEMREPIVAKLRALVAARPGGVYLPVQEVIFEVGK